jgi:hypothetical protein
MTKIYTGVGSRQCPDDILTQITSIAEAFAKAGWTLRSGGADGCDCFFELGADKVNGKKEIYLPWRNFNDNKSSLYAPIKEAFDFAAALHPAWHLCSYGAKKLHARNIHQVIGLDLKTPSDILICWTKDGKEVGGTRTAIVLAKKYSIPIINLAVDMFDFDKYLADY